LPRQIDGSIVFARWCQCALPYGHPNPNPWRHLANTIETVHNGATWQIRLNLCSLQPNFTAQMANQSVQPFLHSSWQKAPIVYNGQPFPPKLPLIMGGSGPHLIHDSLGKSKPTIQTASRSVQLFLHTSLQSVPILYNGTPLPLQNCPFSWGSGPQSDMVPEAHQSPQPKRHLNRFSCFFAGLTSVTDRPTDRSHYSVRSNGPHLHR